VDQGNRADTWQCDGGSPNCSRCRDKYQVCVYDITQALSPALANLGLRKERSKDDLTVEAPERRKRAHTISGASRDEQHQPPRRSFWVVRDKETRERSGSESENMLVERTGEVSSYTIVADVRPLEGTVRRLGELHLREIFPSPQQNIPLVAISAHRLRPHRLQLRAIHAIQDRL
jgi:hypothetical protein